MWAFIYSGVFIAVLIIGVVSKFVQPSWTKDFTAEWSDSVGTVYKDITYGEKDANKFDLYVPADNTKENYGLVVYPTQADLLLVINPETNKFSNGCVQKAI